MSSPTTSARGTSCAEWDLEVTGGFDSSEEALGFVGDPGPSFDGRRRLRNLGLSRATDVPIRTHVGFMTRTCQVE